MRPILAALLASALAAAAPAPPPPPGADTPMPAWTAAQKAYWFKHTERTRPARVVRAGGAARALPAGAGTIAPAWTNAKGERYTLDDYIRDYNVSGIIVLRDGKMLLERYALGRAPDERWTSFSVAKSVTSLLAGAAIADGKLALADPVTKHVPELAGSAYEGVTVRDLLTMSSGVRWNEDYSNPKSDIARVSAPGTVAPGGGDPLLAYLAKLPRRTKPGARFHYNTSDTYLLGRVVTRATGQTLAGYLSEKIWRPYGMEDDAYWLTDGAGVELAGCCLSMRLRDYARLGQFVLEGGAAGGRQVVPSDYLAAATSVRIANDQPAPSGYGYQWWIGARAFEASGIFGQSILIYPKERLVIAVNSAWPAPIGAKLFGALSAMQGATHDAAAPDFPPTMRR